MRTALLLVSIFIGVTAFTVMPPALPRTPNQILHGVYKKMRSVKDYAADVRVKADIPMIKSVPVQARVYFKQPDQFKVESESIVILPIQKLGDLRVAADTNTFTAVLKGTEVLRNIKTQVVHVIPDSDTSDMILGKFWIDDTASLVLKSQITSRSNGTVGTEYFYGAQKAYGLPDSLVYTVDVKKFKLPKGFAVDIHRSTSSSANMPTTGKIYVGLRNYKVNQGVAMGKFAGQGN